MNARFMVAHAVFVSQTESPDAVTLALTSGLPLILIIAALLALIVSLWLLRRYRRAVVNSMRTSASTLSTEALLPEAAVPHVATQLSFAVTDRTTHFAMNPTAQRAHREAMHAPRRVAVIYAVAGICFALIIATAFQLSENLELLPLRFVYLSVIFVWPLVPTIGLVAAPTPRAKRAIIGFYFFALAAISFLVTVGNETTSWVQAFSPWLVYDLPPTILLFAFLNRRTRAVGPLVMIFTLIVIAGALLTVRFLYYNDPVLKWVVTVGDLVELSADGLLIAMLVSGAVFFVPLGWLVFGGIKNRYARKSISDQSLTLDAIWLLFGVTYAIYLAFAAPVWFFCGLLAFLVYKIITAAGFALRRREPNTEPPALKLLLLRVFALGKRSEQFFDALGTHWRYLGSIQIIAGPDLATTNLEPHEFMDFLNGKLARRFIWEKQILEQRLAEADFASDRDWRFRVNEFFCYRDTWKMTLVRLVQENHAVLMDLRGFSPRKSGCIFEINELINAVPLEHVVFVIDQTTDEAFLRQTAQAAWQNMRATSPNRRTPAPPLHMFRLKNLHPRELQQLLRSVCAAAHPS